jgi:hopanoid C-3 methylase
LRILLIQPEYRTGGADFRTVAMPEPLALEMLAASAAEHDVRILDMRIADDLDSQLAEFAPEVVAITGLTTEVYAARDVLRRVRSATPEAFTVVGGHHATLIPEDFFLETVDAIVLGEGERTFSELLQAVAAGRPLSDVTNIIWRQDGAFIANERSMAMLDMDALPLPRRDLVERYRPEYFFLFDRPDSSVATGRGCPYRCNFCSVWKFYGGHIRQMSARRVLDEVHAVDTPHITFVDDNFLMNFKRENEIADLLRAEGGVMRYSMECRTDSIVRHPELVAKWTDIGLYAVLLGLEGASDKTLERVNKKNTAGTNDEAIRILKDLGIIIWGAFLVDPGWTADDFKVLRDYVSEKEITHTQFTVLTPLPGTDLHEQNRDRLLTTDYRCYDTLHSVLPTRLPREEFYEHFAALYRQSDLRPYWDLVSEGKMSVEDCRRGKELLDTMSDPAFYFAGDPILGNRRQSPQAAMLPLSS